MLCTRFHISKCISHQRQSSCLKPGYPCYSCCSCISFLPLLAWIIRNILYLKWLYFSCRNVVRQSVGTAIWNRPVVPPVVTDQYGAMVKWCVAGENDEIWRGSCSSPASTTKDLNVKLHRIDPELPRWEVSAHLTEWHGQSGSPVHIVVG
jgi:hypothetical protein